MEEIKAQAKKFFIGTIKLILSLVAAGWVGYGYFVGTIKAEIESKTNHLEQLKNKDVDSIHKRLDAMDGNIKLILDHLLRRKNNE